MMPIKTIQRRIEALEKEERFRKQQELLSLTDACVYAEQIVLAYYLGGLVLEDEKDLCNEERPGVHYLEDRYALPCEEPLPDEGTCKDLSGALARALKCSSRKDYDDMLIEEGGLELPQRHIDAYRRLFAKVGLDFDTAARDVLFDAFVTMVNQLPDHWLNRLRSDLAKWCPHACIEAGSNLPRGLNGDNFLLFA
jgi:hypothetical protein